MSAIGGKSGLDMFASSSSVHDPDQTQAGSKSSSPAVPCRSRGVVSFPPKARELPTVRRREVITLLGGAAAMWPITARAQRPAMPVVGFLDSRAPDAIPDLPRAFRRGLKETGFVEGENVAV